MPAGPPAPASSTAERPGWSQGASGGWCSAFRRRQLVPSMRSAPSSASTTPLASKKSQASPRLSQASRRPCSSPATRLRSSGSTSSRPWAGQPWRAGTSRPSRGRKTVPTSNRRCSSMPRARLRPAARSMPGSNASRSEARSSAERVGEAQGGARGVERGDGQVVLAGAEGEADGLGEAERHQRVPHRLGARVRATAGGPAQRRQRGRHAVEAEHAAHLLDEVDFTCQVRAPAGHAKGDHRLVAAAVAVGQGRLRLEAQPLQQLALLRGADGEPEDGGGAGGAQRQHPRLAVTRPDVDGAGAGDGGHPRRARGLGDQAGAAGRRQRQPALGIGAALEAL